MPIPLSIKVKTNPLPPQKVGNLTLVPHAQSITVRWPSGGWVFSRPRAVDVIYPTRTERLPIPDVTRWGQLLAVALVALGWAILLLFNQRRDKNEQNGR